MGGVLKLAFFLKEVNGLKFFFCINGVDCYLV